MTTDPLTATALLGTARMPAMPPPPDPALEATWQAIPLENPAVAVLQGLAIQRTLHRAGTKTRDATGATGPCPPETRGLLGTAAVDVLKRLLSGEFPEVLPEWLRLASASARIVPGRVLPALLAAAAKSPALRAAVPALAGERGLWVARRHRNYSWLLEGTAVDENAWDDGDPAERIAWLRQTRTADPARAAAAIAAHWAGEDAPMRESILRTIGANPQACDEPWLDGLALKDRRQEIRDLAATALSNLPGSGFQSRALNRVRGRVKIERRFLKRVIAIDPPAAFDPAWAADGIREKPPQGVGEKAWWLRQMIAVVPVDQWPGLLDTGENEIFATAIDKDWQDPLILGWIDSARRMPRRTLAHRLLPFIAALDPWPPAAPDKLQVMAGLLDALSITARFAALDGLARDLTVPRALDLLARGGEPPPPGTGKAILGVLDQALAAIPTPFARPQARALAVCVPHDGIQPRLEKLSKLAELSAAAEEFATTLEFRRSMISHFTIP